MAAVLEAGLYADSAENAGPLEPPDPHPVVRYRRTLPRRHRLLVTFLVGLNVGVSTGVLVWIALQEPGASQVGVAAFALLVVAEGMRITQNVSLWMFAIVARDPVPIEPPSGLRVALTTTFVPSREPIEMLERTLRAMTRVEYHGSVDAWVLDEGDDPAVQALAASLGVHHFTRKGRPEYHQVEGPFRARTKHGNHNAWRTEHEHRYNVVAHVDPEHAPRPQFLNRTLGYFTDPDVAFVVGPHVYANRRDGFVARAAATHFYPFLAIIQRGGNGMGAPMLVGAAHLYRTAAWDQIGGFQDSITEDHLTGLVVQTTRNPVTAHAWKAVYTPDVVTLGEAPVTWTDYFNQQTRWARGTCDVVLHHSPSLLRRLSRRQRLAYAALQAYYPGLATTWLCGNVLLLLALVFGITPVQRGAIWVLPIWACVNLGQYAMILGLRRYNLAEHERRELAFNAIVLTAVTAPIYAAAVAGAVLRRRLAFVVTGKGELSLADSPWTFRYHLGWLIMIASALMVAAWRRNLEAAFVPWLLISVLVACTPMVSSLRRRRRSRPRSPHPSLGCEAQARG